MAVVDIPKAESKKSVSEMQLSAGIYIELSFIYLHNLLKSLFKGRIRNGTHSL